MVETSGIPEVLSAVPDFAGRFPRFPDLTFAEYVELSELAFHAPGGPDAATRRVY